LVELLVVLAVVGVLAALLIPALGRGMNGAHQAKCASNLRQVGAALQLHLAENNMILPTCWVSLPCNPRVDGPADWRSLGGYLAKYMGEDDPNATVVFLPALQCPAWPVQIGKMQAVGSPPPLQVTYRLVLSRLGSQNPFGGAQGRPKFSALAIQESFGVPPSRFPVIFDLDQGVPLATSAHPEKPVHGSGRNVLFFDGHVGFETGLDFLAGGIFR
jgi:prepilin-type processing-associated H-X9-DG protein